MAHPLIVIEGADGTGKETQAKLLVERLQSHGAATLVSFPVYESPTGKVVKRMIDDKQHPAVELPPYVAAWPYTLDRVAFAPQLHAALARGPVVANRYVESNAGYQAAKLSTTAEQQEFLRTLEEVEYDVFGLPRPAAVVLLDVPPDVARRLMFERAEKAGRPLDEMDKRVEYQARVGAFYRTLAAARSTWKLVPCMAGETLQPPQVIAGKVWEVVQPLLGSDFLHETSKRAGVDLARKGAPSLTP
ncbi:MAG: thymidylate kinase [Candidatus Andersenbacteria bacterium]